MCGTQGLKHFRPGTWLGRLVTGGGRDIVYVSNLGRAIHGQMPVQGETLEELSGPVVHTNFPRKSYGPMIGPYVFPPKRKISPKRKFSAGHPCGHPAKNFGQGLQILENKHLHGHAAWTSTQKLRSEKLRADFSFPNFQAGTTIKLWIDRVGCSGRKFVCFLFFVV